MIKIENSTIINRPGDEVFEFLANSENNPQWQSGTQEVKKTSEGPIGADDDEVACFFGAQANNL